MREGLEFILRTLLIAVIWLGLWNWMKPRNQFERIVRLILLVGGLLGVMLLLNLKGE